jgi:hypothetical protein
MKEELTTAMHAEFTVSQESDNELRALSLLERERDGIPVTDEKLESYGFTRGQFERYRALHADLFSK